VYLRLCRALCVCVNETVSFSYGPFLAAVRAFYKHVRAKCALLLACLSTVRQRLSTRGREVLHTRLWFDDVVLGCTFRRYDGFEKTLLLIKNLSEGIILC